MKYKKYSYIIVLILTLVIGINKTYADNNYYQLSNNKTSIEYSYEENNEEFYITNEEKIKIQKLASDGTGETVNVDCNEIFGDKDDPDSLRYLINEILQYPKIIVPILVILLGTIDFAKAVISPKEDGMKKAQSTFIKRLIIAVAIFFIPVIVDILMWLADIVWAGTGYTSCGL